MISNIARVWSRKGQIFSLDVLVTLVPLMMLIGASAQYLFNAEQEAKYVNQDYELEATARSVLNGVLDRYMASRANVGFSTRNRLVFDYKNCTALNNMISANLTLIDPNYAYYLDVREVANPVRHLCKISGVNTWSEPGLDEKSLSNFVDTSGSWRRLLLANVPPGSPRLSEVSLIVWKRILDE